MRKDQKGNIYFKPIDLGKIHPHWLYDRAHGCYMQRASSGSVPYPVDTANEPAVIRRRKNARAVTHSRGGGASSVRRDTTFTERIEGFLQQQSRIQGREVVAGVAPAPKDQHTVYTSGAGEVVGSGSAAPSRDEAEGPDQLKARKRAGTTTLPIHQSPRKTKKPALR